MNLSLLIKKYRSPLFIVIVLLQILILTVMVIQREILLASEQSIFLECEPIDPTSLFSGDYVILNYRASSLTHHEMSVLYQGKEIIPKNQTVYVGFRPSDKLKTFANKSATLYQPDKISLTYEGASGDSRVVVRAVAITQYNPLEAQSNGLRLRYGVEEYFVPQFEGRTIEKNLKNTTVEIAVGKDGDSAIRSLYINEELVEFH